VSEQPHGAAASLRRARRFTQYGLEGFSQADGSLNRGEQHIRAGGDAHSSNTQCTLMLRPKSTYQNLEHLVCPAHFVPALQDPKSGRQARCAPTLENFTPLRIAKWMVVGATSPAKLPGGL
jgi:hypothetical protein